MFAKLPSLMMLGTTRTVLALTCVGKYWIVKIFANLMNDAQFAKIFPNNACKCSETTTKDLSSDSPKYSALFALSTAIYQNSIPSFFPTYSVQKQTVISMFFLTNLNALGKWESNVNANNVQCSTDPY